MSDPKDPNDRLYVICSFIMVAFIMAATGCTVLLGIFIY